MTEATWPVAGFNQVRRLRVIAAATPGAAVQERVISAPFSTVWNVAADLEGELAGWLFPDIRSLQLTPVGGDRSVAKVLGYSGLRARFDVVLQPGWCLMQSRFLVGAIAADPENEGTRVAILSGFRGPARRLAPCLRMLTERLERRALANLRERVNDQGRGQVTGFES